MGIYIHMMVNETKITAKLFRRHNVKVAFKALNTFEILLCPKRPSTDRYNNSGICNYNVTSTPDITLDREDVLLKQVRMNIYSLCVITMRISRCFQHILKNALFLP
jgi:hypothetical protein